MAETFTANFGWTKPEIGASIDAWGGYLNADLDGIDTTVKSVSNAIPAASSTTPAMDGTAAVGTGTTYARADHTHPSDTAKLNLTGGTLTGALGGTTASFSGTLIATTSIQIQASATSPTLAINGNSGFNRLITGLTGNVLRWNLSLGDGSPESTGDAGSHFNMQNCHDNGVPFDNPLNINRTTGIATFSKPIVNGSDRRLKENIAPIADALASVLGLQGVSYNRIGETKGEIGLIAQDTATIVPEVVHSSPAPLGPDGREVDDDGEPYLGISYGQLTALLIEAVKTLAARLDALEARAGARR